MTEIPFVKPEQLEFAREMEKKILDLPSSTGILFVGIDVGPTRADEDPTYLVWVGVDRASGLESTTSLLVYKALASEILEGVDLHIEVRRGTVRA